MLHEHNRILSPWWYDAVIKVMTNVLTLGRMIHSLSGAMPWVSFLRHLLDLIYGACNRWDRNMIKQ
jgi:hypothetical protein